jgi:Kef-type K+ transport system membrane component KefB
MDELGHLALIWVSVYFASLLAVRTKLTPVLYFLAFGCLMVNTGLLPEGSTPFISAFSEVGIILIMFALGFEEDSHHFVKGIKRAWGIAFFGALAPFVTAYVITLWLWGEQNIALICGLTMTATAVSLTMVSLRSENLHNSEAATGIMTSAILDDIGALALVAILVPIVTGTGAVGPLEVITIVGLAGGFFVLVALLGMWVLPDTLQNRFLQRIPLLGKFGIRHVLSFDSGGKTTLTLLLYALLMGLLAHKFGFHPAIGAYMAGLILKEEYFFSSEIDGEVIDHYKNSRRMLDEVAFSWIGPVFFVELGTTLVFDLDLFLLVLPGALLLFLALFVAQVSSASLAARYTGSFSWEDSMMIGFGMLGRAELAFVVMDIAYVEHQIMSTDAFYTLMITAFLLNVSVPLTIRWWKPRYLKGLAKNDGLPR